MSAMALSVIKQNPKVTYNEFHASLRKLLPSSEYPQTPQLEGADDHKDTLLFEPFQVTPEPPPPPEPPPTPEPPGCIQGFVRAIGKLFKK
jgi:hypothetical protein